MSFLRGTLVLTLAGLAAKIIGALYRVPLAYLLGAEGIGLYQMAYPIYGLAFIISASGVPVAIARLVAKQVAKGHYVLARRIFEVAFIVLLLSGLLSAVLLYRLAPYIATVVLGDSRALYPLRAIAPAVFFVAGLAALRGYFQGIQGMVPIAVSQVIEQLVRVTTMLCLTYVLLPLGLEYAAGGATFGAVTGSLAGVLILGVFFIRLPRAQKNAEDESKTIIGIIGELIHLSLPITFGAFIMPVMETIDAAIVPSRLQAIGFSVQRATALYGQLSGMAVSLIALPTVITSAISFSIIPAITEAATLNKKDLIGKHVQEALYITVLVAMPATVGLYLLPREICQLLFRTPEAAIPLVYLAYSCFFLCLQQTTTGILQGLGLNFVPVKNIIIAVCCNGILNYYLTAIPSLNIIGAALGTGLGFTLAALLNLRAIARVVEIEFRSKEFLLLLSVTIFGMAAAVKKGFIWFLLLTGSNSGAVIFAVFLGAVVYLVLALLFGVLPYRYLAVVCFLRPNKHD